MRIHLAGCENRNFTKVAARAGIKNYLFSYYHMGKTSEKDRTLIFNILNENAESTICDSGLFTLMFGAGKGRTYDLPFMIDYTNKYIAEAKTWGLKNLTIVECDVHKIIGMDAVFHLRELFEKSGMNVMYVWHREEGLKGLMEMAKRYRFIALSVPELRILFRGRSLRYQDAVFNLLDSIRNGVDSLPRIHLLGNTIIETMKTTSAWSCDSTSWLSAGRFGGGIHWNKDRLNSVDRKSKLFQELQQKELLSDPELESYIKGLFKADNGNWDYMLAAYTMAKQFKYCQEYLDSRYPWAGSDEKLKGRIS